MAHRIKNQVLLTGAGFTCNLGGLSGRQFRNRLFNNNALKGIEPIFKKIRELGSDYESIYREIIDEESDFTPDQKRAVIKAYDDAYRELDRRICQTCSPPNAPLSLIGLSQFLDWFSGTEGERETGYIFTLNQDLFLERGYFGNSGVSLPGIRNPQLRSQWVPLDQWEPNGHGPSPIRTIPDQEAVERLRAEYERDPSRTGRLQYFKLHGSMNWRGEEGSSVMVIAGKKKEQINSVPLLRWYFGNFEEIFSRDDLHLLVIGYGFGDPHINEILALAIDQHNLRCSILHPEEDRDKVVAQLSESCREAAAQEAYPNKSEILIRGLDRGQYFDGYLTEAFASQGQPWDTDLGRRLLEAFGPK